MRRVSLTSALVIAGLLTVVPSATASKVVITESRLDVNGGADLASNIKVGISPEHADDYRIIDSVGFIQDPLPGPCLRESSISVRCPSSGILNVDVLLSGAGNFNFFAVLEPASIPSHVFLNVTGGPGDDRITGRSGAGPETFGGDAGDDTLTLGPDPEAFGGDGKGTNISFLSAPALASAAPGGTLIGEAGNDKLTGGPDNDSLNGGPGKDKLKGAAGKDKLKCGGGKDKAIGGGGNDSAKGCESEKGI